MATIFHFPDDIFKYIFLDDFVSISIKISLKGTINNIRIYWFR